MPRLRVMVDNAFSDGPNGLFQLAHLLLSPSAAVRPIIDSQLKVGMAAEVVGLLNMMGRVPGRRQVSERRPASGPRLARVVYSSGQA